MLGLVNMRYKGGSVKIVNMFHMAYYLATPGAPEDQGGEDEHRNCGSAQPDRNPGAGEMDNWILFF